MNIDALLAHEFPLDPSVIYLNHAAVAPWPRRTGETVKRFADENVRQGAAGIAAWLQNERALREQCARLIHARSPETIALLKNTSEGLSIVAHGFPWTPGDNVVISAEEFPSNRIVWESLKNRGVEVRAVMLRGTMDCEQMLLEATDQHTRVISISSVQYASGLRLDLERLGEGCRARGIAFCVDAIQGLGVFPHDVQAMHIDFLAADAHKWLLGPEGVALFYCRPEWYERLQLHQYGWHMVENAGDYDRNDWYPAASARRFEAGSMNTMGAYALRASLSLFEEIGIAEIERRVLMRTEYLFDALERYRDCQVITCHMSGRYAGIVTFSREGKSPEALYRYLQSQGVICVPRGGGVRFSPHAYTPVDQIGEAVRLAMEA